MAGRSARRSGTRPRPPREPWWAPWLLAGGAAAAGALAGAHPTGTPVVDPLYGAVFAAGVTLAAARAGRVTLLWLAMVATVAARSVVVFPAAAGLLLAFAAAFPRRPWRALDALTGALAVQVLLRLPGVGFHGATALIAAAATAPLLLSGAWNLPAGGRRWVRRAALAAVGLAVVFCVPLGVAALRSHAALARGIDAAEGALGSVGAGNASSAKQEMAVAAGDFSAVAREVGPWWTAGARLVPVASQQRQAVSAAVSVARDVAVVADREAGRIDYAGLHYQAGGINLAELRALHGPLHVVDTDLTAGVRTLAGVQSPWLLQPVESRLRRLDREVARAQASASLADQVVAGAPALLGGDGTRRYFVAFMDTSENRGLGGLLASYAILTVRGGHLKLSGAADVGTLNQELAAHGGGHLSGPPDFLARYGDQRPQDYFQDLTISPDLPTVTDVVNQLYTEAGHPPIDGMLLVDPRSLAALLSFTGPVAAPGLGEISASNAAGLLSTGQYALYPAPSQQTLRRRLLAGALAVAFERLSSGSLPGPRVLADTLSPQVHGGDLLFWSLHPQDQPLLRRVGLAGAFPSAAGGDLLGFVTQNSAGNKIDAYLHKAIADDVTYDPSTGEVSATVHVTLRNGAPASGLSSAVIGSVTHDVAPGTNRTWFTIYSPLRLAGVEISGVSHEVVTTGKEFGVEAYSGFVTIPPGGSRVLTARLTGRVAGGSYRMTLYQQPMVIPQSATLDVTPAPGWRSVGPAAWVAGPGMSVVRDFRFVRSG